MPGNSSTRIKVIRAHTKQLPQIHNCSRPKWVDNTAHRGGV